MASEKKATIIIDGLLIVIPDVQNGYEPAKDKGMWHWGFKYKSQVFEFFYYKTFKKADKNFKRLRKAIDDFWG